MTLAPLPAIKLIALDLDGTTLQSDHTISPRTRQAVQTLTQKGVHISICTGRPVRNAGDFAKALGLSQRVMLCNGAVTYDYDTDTFIHHDTLPADVATHVIDRIRTRYPQASSSMERIDGWFWDERRYKHQKPANEPTGVGDIRDFVHDGIIKLLFKDFTGAHDIEEMAQSLRDLPVYVTWSSDSLLEVMAQGINKKHAVARWAQECGIARANTMAFGDQDNDKEMLQWAAVGVAMGNAPARIQQIADYVTSSNNDEGVARVLEQLIAEQYS